MCYSNGVSNEVASLVPPPSGKPPAKPLWRAVLRIALIMVGAVALPAGAFEGWRQSTLMHERASLQAEIDRVDGAILHGKTPVAYFNAKAQARNGWAHWQAAVHSLDTEADARLSEINDWHATHAGQSSPPLPDRATCLRWLEATEPLARHLREAASAEVIARTYGASETWQSVALHALQEVGAARTAALRVEMLIEVGRADQAEEELLALSNLCCLRHVPHSMVEAMVALGLGNSESEIAVRVAGKRRLSRSTLEVLIARWPKAVPMLIPMLEGELVWMVWMAQTEALITSADGAFAWAPPQEPESIYSLTRERGVFVGINLRRALRSNMRHLSECLSRLIEGEAPHKLPTPHDATSPLATDVRDVALRVVRIDAVLALRKTAMELRLLELDGPLARQRQQVEEFVAKRHGIAVAFEGEECVLSITQAQFPGASFDASESTIRLAPLP